ncbi:MAG: hypothetical protein R3A48_02210, partial [Polyangiales bacterium]
MNRCLPLLFVLASSCAINAVSRGDFSLQRPASNASEVDAVAARVGAAHAPPPRSLAVLVAADPADGFAIHSLPDGARLGLVSARIQGRPLIAGEVVLARVGDEVVGYGADGAARWRVPSRGVDLVGASADHGLVAFTLGGGGVSRRNSVLYVVDEASGSVRVRRDDRHAFGVPALIGDDLALPWDGQNLSIFSVATDTEVARVRSRDDVIGFALRAGPSLWYGARALYRFDRASATGQREGSTRFSFERTDLPGGAPFALDGYTSLRAGGDARERVRLLWRPDPAAVTARVAADTVYALFHQVVFGLDAQTRAVRWAHLHNANIVGAEATTHGALIVDEVGNLAALDAYDGHVTSRAALGGRTSQAVFQIGADFTLPSAGEAPSRSAIETLSAVALSTETRLLPARTFAVNALAASREPGATAALVRVLTDTSVPPELRATAGEAVGRVTVANDAILRALEAHYDFITGSIAPPVGPLARGAAASADRRATSQIAAHLLDPATPTTALPELASALRALGDATAVPSLEEFVRRYHADVGRVVPPGGTDAIEERELGEQEHIDAALEQAIEALARLGGAREERLFARVEAHPNTPDPVRAAASRGLRLVRPASAPTPEAPEAPEASAPEASAPAPAVQTGATAAMGDRGVDLTLSMPAARHSQPVIDAAFNEVRARLLACLRGAPSRPAQVRIQFRYDGDGRVSQAVVLPTSFARCMAPVAQSVTLPPSAASREL